MGSPSASSGSPSGGGTKAKKDLEVSGYEAAITKQNKGTKKEINKGLNITTSSNDNKRSGYKPADYNPEKDDTDAKMSLFREQGATNIKNMKFQTPTTAILSGPLQAGSRYNRDYFANEVLGKGAYKGTTKQDFEKMSRASQESLYSGYMSGRQSGKTDAYGNLMPGVSVENVAHRKADGTMTTREVVMRDNGGAMGSSGQVVQAPTVTSPTEAEVSQSAATDADQDNILLRKRRTKARGRSLTIATSPTGATGSLTLGRPSLLGR